MSEGSVPDPLPAGPREAYIQDLWSRVWKEHAEGGVFEPLVAIAESELSSYGAALPAGDAVALQDFRSAQNTHLFQSRHFAAHIASIEVFREAISRSIEQVYDQMTKFNEHSVKSLTLANGAAVIAALTYIQAKQTASPGFYWIVGICSIGYLLTLLGSHVIVGLSSKIIEILSELRALRLPTAARNTKLKQLTQRNRLMLWVSRPIFYGSAACLIASIWIGVTSLTDQQVTTKPAQKIVRSTMTPQSRLQPAAKASPKPSSKINLPTKP